MAITNRRSPLRIAALASAGLIALIVGLPTLVGLLSAWNNVDAGHVAVLRNGGVLSDSNIRGYLDPASPLTYTGIWSTEHVYPAQQRTYTISADQANGDKPGYDVVSTPSSDGVPMAIEGTLYYQLNLDHTVLGQFDNKYGTRSYTFNGHSYRAYDGDDGWNAFMNTQVRPVLDNDLRQQIADVSCAELNAACALVKDATQAAAAAAGKSSNVNYAAVQNAINQTLATDITTQLGGAFLTNVRFTLVKADLPSNVQDAANSALAAFAQVSQQQALVQQAQLQAQANEAKQKGYTACPACQVIDELKALPPNLTTFAPGASSGIAIGK
jgi:hypothetical protein